VAIVSERIDEPDARNGFILDGFPRTVPQAHALDRMLKEKGLGLDAVIELKVDEGMLLERIEKRTAEMQARGEPLRPDDNPDVLRRRLLAYRDQTAPLAAYYQLQNVLRSVDGMAPIHEVANSIDRVLLGPPAKKQPAKDQDNDHAKSPALAAAKKPTKTPEQKPVRASAGKTAAPSVTTKSKPKPARTKGSKPKQATKPAGAARTARKATKRKAKSSARAASGRKALPRKRRQQRLTKRR
jgi:adenylate kinase